MSKDDQTTWHVTGETYHLYQDCSLVRRSRERPSSMDRSGAERMGFKLCRACAAREAREEADHARDQATGEGGGIMSDRTVWIVMGNIYHLFSNCGHINGKPAFTRTQDQAEMQGFHLCKRCARQERGVRVQAAKS